MLGGISVHLKRVHAKLRKQGNCVVWYDIENEYIRRSFFAYWCALLRTLWAEKPDEVYYHGMTLHRHLLEPVFLVVCKWLLGYRLLIMHHSSRFLAERGCLYRVLLRWLVQRVDQQVFVGTHTQDSFKAIGCVVPGRISVESPFLPPDLRECDLLYAQYPESLKTFVAGDAPVVVINASRCVLYHGIDLYGIDMAIALVQELRKDWIPVQAGDDILPSVCYPVRPERSRRKRSLKLVIAISTVSDPVYYEELRARTDDRWCYWLVGFQQELWPLFAHCDVLVRPTASDTFGISVQEALLVGTPAVASDVCERPAGTVLFNNRDQQDFNRAVKKVLKNE